MAQQVPPHPTQEVQVDHDTSTGFIGTTSSEHEERQHLTPPQAAAGSRRPCLALTGQREASWKSRILNTFWGRLAEAGTQAEGSYQGWGQSPTFSPAPLSCWAELLLQEASEFFLQLQTFPGV